MTKMTIQQCILPAKRAYQRAEAKVKVCKIQRGLTLCGSCTEFFNCTLVQDMEQLESNLNEINRKADECH